MLSASTRQFTDPRVAQRDEEYKGDEPNSGDVEAESSGKSVWKEKSAPANLLVYDVFISEHALKPSPMQIEIYHIGRGSGTIPVS
jgi:hypothetical protein